MLEHARSLGEIAAQYMRHCEAPGGVRLRVGVMRRIRNVETFLATGNRSREVAVLREQPGEIAAGDGCGKPMEPEALAEQVAFQHPDGCFQVLLRVPEFAH